MSRFRALVLSLVVLLFSVVMADPVRADDAGGPPELPDSAAAPALAALESAQSARATGEGVTMALRQLSEALPQLSGDRLAEAERVLARPDGENGSSLDGLYGGNWTLTDKLYHRSTCKDGTTLLPFCVHWIASTSLLNSRHESTLATVQQTIDIMKQVWRKEVGSLGYRRPTGDGSDGNRGGETRQNLVDIYLSDLDGYLGYAVCESGAQQCPGYLVLENDYAEFASTATGRANLRRVTAAHEFFHLIQYAYDSHEHPWLMESTATWMESQVYSGIKDNRSFIRYGSLARPHVPLPTTNGRAEYGDWVFHELYARRFGVGVVRDVWQRAAQVAGTSWRPALQGALAARGSALQPQFRTFGAASNVPARHWSDGAAYPRAAISSSWTLRKGALSTGWRSTSLKRFSSANYRFVPGSSLSGDWKLRVVVNTPSSRIGTASLLVFHRDGRISTVPLRLNSSGDGAASVAFRYGGVKRVILNVGNAGVDTRSVRFRATAFR